jgi:hypothetical protein
LAKSSAETVEGYLVELTPDRRESIAAVRDVILSHLPIGYVATMQHGMVAYVIPLETYPMTYNKQPLVYAQLASQKSYMSLYLMNIYGDQAAERWFTDQYEAAGKPLDMGKSCVRFKKLADLPLDVIGMAIARTPVAEFVAIYEASRNRPSTRQVS